MLRQILLTLTVMLLLSVATGYGLVRMGCDGF